MLNMFYRGVFRTQSNIYDRVFMIRQKFTVNAVYYFCKKSFIVDVQLGSKYTSVIA